MLTASQIKTLNRARDALEDVQARASKIPDFDQGQLAEACTAAELAIFNVMNIAGGIPEGDLFNRKAAAPPPLTNGAKEHV